MQMRYWYRRWWLTELMAFGASGLTILALYEGLGWKKDWQILWVFLIAAVVAIVVAEVPHRKVRRERAEGVGEMHKLLEYIGGKTVPDPRGRQEENRGSEG
ncbi:hypothetical protein OIU91_03700 [Streptomyces sp. NBC_01456]|uniref:hypothetical protein n=1 Tax=unclassified Streptomyces TaxID=2593676 RepID=UPI002E30A6EF|nr:MULTISPECIES: hypothetical protein [unclassified Streptomyces]